MAPTPTFYVLHGDDALRIEEEVARMKSRMGDSPNAGLNTDEFDGTTVSAAQVMSAASSYPFLADRRMVIVKDMLTWLTRKGAGVTGKQGIELLVQGLPDLPDTSRLIFVERDKLADTHKVLQLARSSEYGLERAFAAPKDSTTWIVKRAQETYQTEIEPKAAVALSSVVLNDLHRADNELIKLVSYVDGERAITEEDVALLTPYVAEASLFAMVDALAEGRAHDASQLIHRLLEQQEDPFSLYGMIVRQFRLLLLAKEHLVNGGYPGGISEAIGVHKFVAEKLAKQTRGFTLEQLEQIYRTLHDYDLKMKTGRIEPLLALDMLIAGLAR